MSLILQALKKAEAERALGQVPSMHATLAEEAGDGTRQSGRRAIAWTTGLAVAAALAAWAAYMLWLPGRHATVPAAATASAPPRAGEAVAPPGPTARQAAVEPPSVQASSVPDELPTAATVTSVAAPPATATAPGPQSAPARVAEPATPPVSPVPPKAAAAPIPVPATAKATEAPPQRLDELPPAVRRLLPPLVVGGAIHAERSADRMVILDGEVRREGDTVAQDLLVDRIEPRSVVLRHRGQALRIPF